MYSFSFNVTQISHNFNYTFLKCDFHTSHTIFNISILGHISCFHLSFSLSTRFTIRVKVRVRVKVQVQVKVKVGTYLIPAYKNKNEENVK